MASTMTTPPAIEPVSLATAKAHLKVDHSHEDQLIANLITAARQHVEYETGMVMIDQDWSVYFNHWPENGQLVLPLVPVISISGVYVYGDDDVASQIDAAHYVTDTISRPARIVLRGSRQWANPGRIINGIEVKLKAGFGATDTDVPADLIEAILLLVAHWFENRQPVFHGETIHTLPRSVSALLKPYRMVQL